MCKKVKTMTKIIIQTIDLNEHVIAESERILHNFQETPYDFSKTYEELIEDHKLKLSHCKNESNNSVAF